jgi:hypothetical protein
MGDVCSMSGERKTRNNFSQVTWKKYAGMDWRIILKWILKKYDVRIWAGVRRQGLRWAPVIVATHPSGPVRGANLSHQPEVTRLLKKLLVAVETEWLMQFWLLNWLPHAAARRTRGERPGGNAVSTKNFIKSRIKWQEIKEWPRIIWTVKSRTCTQRWSCS